MSTLICCLALLAAPNSDVEELIRNLDSDKFAERRTAAQRLTEKGADVFEELVKAAQSPSAEVQQRCLDILKGHFQNGEQATRDAAREALETLAKTDAQVASRAQQALTPSTPGAVDPFGNRAAPARVLAAQLQIQQARAPAQAKIRLQQIQQMQKGNNVRRRIAFSDGKKSVKIEQNGEKIKVEITEKKDGKNVTQKYEAKSAAELKKNHPDAYKEYQKHMGRNRARAVPAAQAVPVRPAIRPRQAPGRPARQLQPAQRATQQRIIEALKRSEKQLQDKLKKLQDDKQEENPGSDAQSAENLERRLKQLQTHREQIEKRLQAAAN